MGYDSKKAWGELYSGDSQVAYPAEGVIRIFKGTFPALTMPRDHANLSILDMGCGDGRHLPFLNGLGFNVCAVEVSETICSTVRRRMEAYDVKVDIRAGHAGSLPYEDSFFDRLLTWNSCYYMSFSGPKFGAHVAEMARVLKPGGWIIASLPKKTNFIFQDSTASDATGYRIIANDYFGMRNGEIMRCIEDRADLVESFEPKFENFCHADLDMEWFGLPYHWHVFCAQRKVRIVGYGDN